MGLAQKRLEIAQGAVSGVHVGVVGNVVAIVAPRGGAERQHPDGGHSEVLQIVELQRQPGEIAHAVAILVEEGAHMNLVNNCILEPKGIWRWSGRIWHQRRRCFDASVVPKSRPAVVYSVIRHRRNKRGGTMQVYVALVGCTCLLGLTA